jgi:hypothetical protein
VSAHRRLVTALSLLPALSLILLVPAAPAHAAVTTVITPPDPVLVGQFMPADGPRLSEARAGEICVGTLAFAGLRMGAAGLR